MRHLMRAAIAGFCWLLVLASAAQAEPQASGSDNPFPPVSWTASQAAQAGWTRTEIDVGAPDLSYATYLPPNAKVETASFEGEVPEGPGRVKVVGKYGLPFAFGDITGTVTAFQLRSTGSAVRLCGAILDAEGYTPRSIGTGPDRTHAQLFSARFDDKGNPKGGAFTDCRTRGQAMLVHHFAFPLAPATEAPDLDARIDAALQVVLPLVSNLAFRNGRPDGYGDASQPVELTIRAAPRTVPIPKTLAVSFNDFDGRGGAQELHLLQQENGVAHAMIWLGVSELAERPDLAKAGPDLALTQFRLQLDDALPEPKLLANEATDPLPEGATGQSFRFSVADRQGRDAGTLDGEAYWSEGRLFVVTFYSALKDEGTFSSIIARLPGETAYDLLRLAVRSEQ